MPAKIVKPRVSINGGSPQLDDWENIVTGIGRRGRDKRSATTIHHIALNEQEAEEVYAGSGLARRITDLLPSDMLREGFTWSNLEPDVLQATENKLTEIGVRTKIKEGMSWGRLYGGAALLMCVDDGLRLDEPLDLTKIRSLKALTLLSRWELFVQSTDIIRNINNPDFGKPRYYTLRPRRAAGSLTADETEKQVKDLGYGVRIHYSRLITFDGATLPLRLWAANGFWHDSVLSAPLNSIADFAISHNYAAASIHDFNIGVMQMKNLSAYLAANRDADVQKRIEIMAYTKSMLGLMLLDEGENFDQKSRNVAGMGEILDRLKTKLQSETEYPHTVLFNEGPKDGLGGQGEGQEKMYYNLVAAKQEEYLAPKLDRVLQVIFSAKDGPTRGIEPEDWGYEFSPLFQLSEKELADTRKINAETDTLYYDMGADPEEILESRFGGPKYNNDLKIQTFDVEPTGPDQDVNKKTPAGPDAIAAAAKQAKVVTDTMLDAAGRVIQAITVSKYQAKTVEEARAIAETFGGKNTTGRETGDAFLFRIVDPATIDPTTFMSFNPMGGVNIIYAKLKD